MQQGNKLLDKNFDSLKKLNIEKFNKLPMHIMDKILELHVNSKAISTYIFLCSLAHVIDEYEYVYVPDINANRLYLLMRQAGINTNYRQIANSLDELKNFGLISFAFSYEKETKLSIIDLVDAYIDTKKKYDNSNRQYRNIPQILLTERFYSLEVQGKRLFLYLYNKVVFSGTPIRNILKEETYESLCSILRVNRPQKIRDTIELIDDLIDAIHLDQRKNIDTFMFKLKEKAKAVVEAATQIVAPSKSLIKRIIDFFENHDYTYTIDELKQIAEATMTWSRTKLHQGLAAYVKANVETKVKHIVPYFRKLSYTLYFQGLK